MHEITPAMVLRGGGGRPRAVLLALLVLGVLWAAGSAVALAVELVGGSSGTFEYGGRLLPAWVLWAVSAAAAGYVTWDTYANWRRTGPRHGMLDLALEAAGLRLLRERASGRPLEVLVARGEAVEIDAQLVRKRMAGADRTYRFTVSAPGGSFTFTQPVHVEKLSLGPLDEFARGLGITVRTSGAAGAVHRSVPVA